MAVALQMNATFSYATVAIKEVTKVSLTKDGEHVTHSAGIDGYLTFQALVKQRRTMTVTCDDAKSTLVLVPGAAAATVAAVLKGAGGASDVTIGGSFMCIKCDGGANHASVDHGSSAEFSAVSSDGSTDPVSVT